MGLGGLRLGLNMGNVRGVFLAFQVGSNKIVWALQNTAHSFVDSITMAYNTVRSRTSETGGHPAKVA